MKEVLEDFGEDSEKKKHLIIGRRVQLAEDLSESLTHSLSLSHTHTHSLIHPLTHTHTHNLFKSALPLIGPSGATSRWQ